MTLKNCPRCHNYFTHTDLQCPHCSSSSKPTFALTTAILLGLGSLGCGDKSTDSAQEDTSTSIAEPSMALDYGVPWVDNDNDGWEEEVDCDDNNPFVFPGAAEQESETECMKDEDEDGFGDDSVSAPVVAGTDCDDSDATIHPQAEDPNLDCSTNE